MNTLEWLHAGMKLDIDKILNKCESFEVTYSKLELHARFEDKEGKDWIAYLDIEPHIEVVIEFFTEETEIDYNDLQSSIKHMSEGTVREIMFKYKDEIKFSLE